MTPPLSSDENQRMLAELLGCKGGPEVAAAAEKASDGRAQVIALGVVLAAMESSVTREAWRAARPVLSWPATCRAILPRSTGSLGISYRSEPDGAPADPGGRRLCVSSD